MPSQHYFWNIGCYSKYFFCPCLNVLIPHCWHSTGISGFFHIWVQIFDSLIYWHSDYNTFWCQFRGEEERGGRETLLLFWLIEITFKEGDQCISDVRNAKKKKISHNVRTIGICDFNLLHKEDRTGAHHKMQYRDKFFKNTKCSDLSRWLTS